MLRKVPRNKIYVSPPISFVGCNWTTVAVLVPMILKAIVPFPSGIGHFGICTATKQLKAIRRKIRKTQFVPIMGTIWQSTNVNVILHDV